MPGVVDLTRNAAALPGVFVVDTNVLAERVIAAFPGLYPPITVNAQRSSLVFQSMAAGARTGVITPTVLQEFVHFAIKTKYKHERVVNRAGLIARFGMVPDWNDLYKRDPGLLQRFRPDLDEIVQTLLGAGMVIASPGDASRVSSTASYDVALIETVCTYGLDSGDAAILLEARNLGVVDIVTLDRDLMRARADFTIYTWL